jgi:hypothetical protein
MQNMKFLGNVKDDEHVPYPILDKDPHIIQLCSYFRPSDYYFMGLGAACTGIIYASGISY